MANMCMKLLSKETDVWRPVQVTALEGGVYRVEGTMPPQEIWEFPPGSLVRVRWKTFSDGQQLLIPTGLATTTVTAILADHYKRILGIFLGLIPLFALSAWLSGRPEGGMKPGFLLLLAVALTLIGALALVWMKPRSLVAKWSARSALGFGILSLVVLIIP